jgi:hypothetical protein
MDETQQVTEERRKEQPSIKMVPGWLITTHLGTNLFLVTVIILLVCGGVWLGDKLWQRQNHYDKQMEVVITNMQVLHEEVTIRDIVNEKLPGLPLDLQAKIAFEIYDLGRRTGVPSWLILGIIDTESCWKMDAGSSAGAQGLMQLMPGTAMAYARINGITITDISQIREPVFNIRTGVQVLMDNYKGAVLAGKSYPGDYTRALWFYNGKGESYARMVMEKVVPYRKRLDAPLQGKIQAPVSPEAPKS